MTAHSHRLHSLHHLLLGVALVFKGIAKLAHHPAFGVALLLCSVVVLGYFLFMVVRHQQHPIADIVIHILEAGICVFTAHVFYTEGKEYLPLVLLTAAAGFLAAAVIATIRFRKATHAIMPSNGAVKIAERQRETTD